MSTPILVPLDGSEFGEMALPYATLLAKRTSLPLHLVHVHVPHTPGHMLENTQYQFEGVDMEEYDRDHRDEEEHYLRTLTDGLATDLTAPVTWELLDGHVCQTLECRAREVDAALVVMSTHGRSGLSRLWLGSNVDGLVRHTDRVMLLVPSKAAEAAEGQPSMGHVLLALDGSELGEAIIDPALSLTRSMGGRLTLLHVIPTHLHVGARAAPIPVGHLEASRSAAREYLDRIADGLAKRGVEASVRILEHRSVSEGIIEAAEQEGADLIALGTHGRGQINRLVLGSVADKVIRSSSTPVLVRKPPVLA